MKKCRETCGITWVTFLVLILTILLSGLFIVDGYINHLKHARLIFDQTQVSNAIKDVKIQYMMDGFPEEGVTYYYDSEGRRLTDWSGVSRIKGYGRSYEKQNRHGETGAAGIPNLGGKNGAQLLVLSVEDENTITVRWQGNRLTYYDYTLMTPKEKDRLSVEQWRQIELDIQKSQQDLDEIPEEITQNASDEAETDEDSVTAAEEISEDAIQEAEDSTTRHTESEKTPSEETVSEDTVSEKTASEELISETEGS